MREGGSVGEGDSVCEGGCVHVTEVQLPTVKSVIVVVIIRD